MKEGHASAINRLTALWAMSESGLGGVMHALHIPFTGFFVGGFAVVIIGLLAYYSNGHSRTILRSTLLVILVKAAVSPHSPFPAYIAVAFQGAVGALCYSIIPSFRIASLLFGFVALLESALQKFLLTTLIFGRSVWEALDLFFQGILKDFHLSPDFSFSFWLITLYTTVYAAWGLIIGWWIAGLPRTISSRSAEIHEQFNRLEADHAAPDNVTRRKRPQLLFTSLVLVFIGGVFFWIDPSDGAGKAIYVVCRTIAVLLILFLLIDPVIKWALHKWKGKNSEAVQALTAQLPGLRSLVRPAYRLASLTHKGPGRYKEFILVLLILTLDDKQPN